MKLVIREYISLLKESKELDKLLPDLLLTMGIEPISKPQIGVRQYGVDLAAVGTDEDNIKKLFLFTIKQGDIGRSDWNSGVQAVRQSLDDIKDVYLESHIASEHKELQKKIVLCTGGDLKQDTLLNWTTYTSKNEVEGSVKYDFWGGDKLSLLIEEYMFSEQLLPTDLRTNLRKTLALLGDTDYNLSDYYALLEQILFQSDLASTKKNKIIKSFRLIHLCLNIVFSWSKHEGNLKPALLAGERTILLLWEFLRRNALTKNRALFTLFYEIYNTLINIYTEYFEKLQKHCHVQDGLSGNEKQYIQENLTIFEQLGIISTLGVMAHFDAVARNDDIAKNNSQIILEATKALIENHMATNNPCFDSHAIEISTAILLLAEWGETEFVDIWIKKIINHIAFSYNMGRYFPIQSDSFDDLVALNISNAISKDKLMKLSTLIPILAQWCVVLGLNETYSHIKKYVSKYFPKCTLQIWYPDDDTDKYIYSENAAFKSGAVDAPITLTDSIDEMKQMIQKIQKNTISSESLSSIEKGILALPILSSRHFRTPFMPFYWQLSIIKSDDLSSKKEIVNKRKTGSHLAT